MAGYGGFVTPANAMNKDDKFRKDNAVATVIVKQQGYPQVLGSGKDSESKYDDPDSDMEIMVPKRPTEKYLASNAPRRKRDGLEDESPDVSDPAIPAEVNLQCILSLTFPLSLTCLPSQDTWPHLCDIDLALQSPVMSC